MLTTNSINNGDAHIKQ